MTNAPEPGDWGLGIGPSGELKVGERSAVELARHHGTPLHVVHEAHLQSNARSLVDAFVSAYPGKVSVHYAFKCNSVPGVVDIIRRAGLKAEVMSPYELDLARRIGCSGQDIVVNGPCKTEPFLRQCLEADVRFIVIDSLEELAEVDRLGRGQGRAVDVLFRINPDCTPRGMNAGAATGSRKGCAFGLDLARGEPEAGLALLPRTPGVRFRGFHFHIGTGIHDPRDYGRTIRKLKPLVARARAQGHAPAVLDVGGGFPSPTSREMTSPEMLLYQAFGRLPSDGQRIAAPGPKEFAEEISRAVEFSFGSGERPELILEPGRAVASSSQFLLLTVHRIKSRPGARQWLITDGGLGTVTLPTFYECHEIFLCNDVDRPRTETVTIVGPVCFASDVVYRNKRMPRVRPGEVLALMDTGAYFTALESTFGFGRPAVVAVQGRHHRLLRRAEAFADMVGRDLAGPAVISLRRAP